MNRHESLLSSVSFALSADPAHAYPHTEFSQVNASSLYVFVPGFIDGSTLENTDKEGRAVYTHYHKYRSPDDYSCHPNNRICRG
jgi:hypothetical protein